MMIFPIVSGIIVTMKKLSTLKGYYVQGAFMFLSLIVPVVYMAVKKIKLSQIGFIRAEKGSTKTVLYFVPLIVSKIGFFFFGLNYDIRAIIALIFFTTAIGI